MVRVPLLAVAVASLAALCAAPAGADTLGLDLVSDSPMAGGADSMDATGTQASADGTRVFFTTKEPLVAEDTDAETDVYERAAGATTLVSDGPADPDPNTPVNLVAVSTDGGKALLYTAGP